MPNNLKIFEQFVVDSDGQTGSVQIGRGSTSASRNDDFLYIPTANGILSGTPVGVSGLVPLAYNTVDDRLAIYNGIWRNIPATLTATASLDFGNLGPNGGEETQTVTVTGATTSDFAVAMIQGSPAAGTQARLTQFLCLTTKERT